MDYPYRTESAEKTQCLSVGLLTPAEAETANQVAFTDNLRPLRLYILDVIILK